MSEIRAIGTIGINSETEEVFFTEDFEAPVEEFIRSGDEVIYDEVIEDNLPVSFPRESTLRKELF